MGLVINSNLPALNAGNILNKNSKKTQKNMEKLASGFKINHAADDASGLAISEKMRNKITALDTVVNSCEDGINLLHTSEGNIAEIQDMITRMVELAGKSANGVLDNDDRDLLQDEMNQLCAEVDRIASTANFNGAKLLSGEYENKDVDYIRTIRYVGSGFILPDDGAMTGKSLDSTASTIINYFNKHPDEFPNELVDNIGKVKEKYKYTTHYENGELKSVDKGDDIPIDASEECPPLGNYTLYYKKDGSQIVINPSGSGAPSGFNPTDWVSTSINKRYDPYMDLVKETITETDCLKFKIGDTSTQADMLKYKRPDLHTDKIFKIESFREVTHTRLDKPATGGAFGGGVEHYSRGTSYTTLEAVADGFISNPISPYEKGISYDIQTPDHALKVYEHARGVSERMSHERGTIGALQNRLEHSVNTSTIASENTSNARSRINDTDMAKEIAKFTMNNVANQAAQAMLSQANSQPQSILSLLQG